MTLRGISPTAHLASSHEEGGGFRVRRPVGGNLRVDPFLMLDHLGPVKYGPGEAVGAPDHPHRGFETGMLDGFGWCLDRSGGTELYFPSFVCAVTYLLDGEIHHKDSNGNEGTLKPGWVQWMTAGSGIVSFSQYVHGRQYHAVLNLLWVG